ncbi:4-(cytidine 5'-diphospho)-2-C-methyl-D-erythritol kinase [Chloroflexota bacterium]
MLILLAPAKLNLTLEVLTKRPDGFHEISSLIQTINLGDRIELELSQNIEFKSGSSDWVAEESLVYKAVDLVQKATECTKGAIIEIDKYIPLMSGLGGDSSDAAAILRGLNELWELGLSLEELIRLASSLGSDVAFFLYGGTALVGGRGEVVTPMSPYPHMWVVVLVPPVPRLLGKTGQLYASLKDSHYTDGEITERVVSELKEGREPSVLSNAFENVAFDNFSGLMYCWQRFVAAGAHQVHLAGSGPTLFTLVKESVQAARIYVKLQKQGVESYLAETLAAADYME